MLLPRARLLYGLQPKVGGDAYKHLTQPPNYHTRRSNSISTSDFSFKPYLKCNLTPNNEPVDTSTYKEGFSALGSDTPWKKGSTWTTMSLYMLFLHIPLGYGGLSIVSYVLQQPILYPQTQVVSLVIVETVELIAALYLLNNVAMPEYKLLDLFKVSKSKKERNWLLSSAISFGFILLLILFTMLVADQLYMDDKVPMNNNIVKEIIASTDTAKVACFFLYCVIAPLLEETIYRGFLLRSLASAMNWDRAVVISSIVFSAAHFSGDNFVQLFIIGCVLGCSYCWTGSLRSPILVHSLYNALTLLFSLF